MSVFCWFPRRWRISDSSCVSAIGRCEEVAQSFIGETKQGEQMQCSGECFKQATRIASDGIEILQGTRQLCAASSTELFATRFVV